MTRRRIGFVVRGRVQGVGFRAHTQRQAQRLGLVGFVRNESDGAVRGEAEGAAAAVAELVTWLGRGPGLAKVRELVVEELPVVGDGVGGFEVRR